MVIRLKCVDLVEMNCFDFTCECTCMCEAAELPQYPSWLRASPKIVLWVQILPYTVLCCLAFLSIWIYNW